MASKKWKKRLKKLGKNLSKVLKVAAPVAAFAIGGPAGLALGAGGALGGAALTPGSRKKKFKSLKRSALAVGAGVAGAGALGIISGSGIGAGGLTSIAKIGSDIFGGGSPAATAKDPAEEMSFGYSQKPAASDMLGGGGFLGSLFGGGTPSKTSDPSEAGERGGGPIGGGFGRGGGPVEAGTAGGEKPGINPLFIALGIGAAVLLSRKKGK